MVDLSVTTRSLLVRVLGVHKLWALKGSLEIGLDHVAAIRADAQIARRWWHGIRMPGTNIPGVLTAGTFYQNGKRVFWDVHDPSHTVVIELHDEPYHQLVIEVADPQAAVELVTGALRHP